MTTIEKSVVVAALVYMLVYVPYFFVQIYRIEHAQQVSLVAIAVPHFVGMGLNFVALAVTMRDLYLRSFPSENSKLTWGLLIICTGGIGWLIYLSKFVFKARSCDQA